MFADPLCMQHYRLATLFHALSDSVIHVVRFVVALAKYYSSLWILYVCVQKSYGSLHNDGLLNMPGH